MVWGYLAHIPFGGMVWQVLHYLAGLRGMGFEVWYVEDSDHPILDLRGDDWAATADENAAFAAPYLCSVGLDGKWIVRDPGSRRCHGARDWDGLLRLYKEADLVVNLCGSHELNEHHDGIRHLMYLETDPGKNQVALASGVSSKVTELARYDTLATYATNLGGDDCLIPSPDRSWIRTVPLVHLPYWGTCQAPRDPAYTTIMNWSSPERLVRWQDQTWAWSKRDALARLRALPDHCAAPMRIALRRAGSEVVGELGAHGWSVIDAQRFDRPGAYRRFIRESRGEFSVAKQLYVAPRSGWLSDRTVCYLAAGRPAVVERTGVAGIPLGLGLLDFSSLEEAGMAIKTVESDYERHATAARELAAGYFSAEKVLRKLLTEAGLW